MLRPPGWLAADAGFEPALPDPESGVLPLDESATACSENHNRWSYRIPDVNYMPQVHHPSHEFVVGWSFALREV